MALTLTQRDAVQSTSNVATYNGTASITPGANALILVTIVNSKASAPDAASSITGYGITFTQIASITAHTVGTPTVRVSVWRGMSAAPTSTQLAVTFPASQTSCCIVVDEFGGVDTGGTNGSAAVVQSGTNRADSVAVGGTCLVSLAALGGSGNNGIYIGALSSTNNAALDPSPSSGFTQSRDQGIGTPTNGIFAGYSLGTTQTNVGIVVATATKNVAVVALEVKVRTSFPLLGRRGRKTPWPMLIREWWSP